MFDSKFVTNNWSVALRWQKFENFVRKYFVAFLFVIEYQSFESFEKLSEYQKQIKSK